MMNGSAHPRILLLTKVSSYRAPAFMAAAERLGIEVVQVVDAPQSLAGTRPDRLALDFSRPEEAVEAMMAFAREKPVAAILAVDDSGSLLAARASAALGLPHNDPQAAEAARDKYVMRRLLAPAGVPVPAFQRFSTADDPGRIAGQVTYPCVVKPLRRTGSQGVIRADTPAELETAIARLQQILVAGEGGDGPYPYLIEDYIPGVEVALEGMLENGELHVLALFDKPDPLEGPFFEETIYVTPSRLPEAAQEAIAGTTRAAAAALGLRRGPIHAELRLNDGGPWLLEVAGRSIGGLCSQILRFGVDRSLEELILRQAVGMGIESYWRQEGARGVMMIPIPARGLLRRYDGVEDAEAVAGITGVEMTAPLNNLLTPLPEGDSYLGFIFALAETPAGVEAALREAHARLKFEIEPVIPLMLR